MKLSLSIRVAVTDSDLPVRLLLRGFFVCFWFGREFQNSFHSCGLSIVSVSSSLRPFDVFCIKLGEGEGGEVTVLPGFIFLKYLQQQTFWEALGYNIRVD